MALTVQVNAWLEKYSRQVVLVFFISLFLLGMNIYKDYGIAWDEAHSQELGVRSLAYVLKPAVGLRLEECGVFHGSWVEIAHVVLQKVMRVFSDSRSVFLVRHAFNYFLFCWGVFFFYLLCRREFKDWKMGLLGAVFLVMSPRIFADAFYNSKDIVFLSLVVAGVKSIKTRQMGQKNWIDIEINVSHKISVLEVHVIAEKVREAIMSEVAGIGGISVATYPID